MTSTPNTQTTPATSYDAHAAAVEVARLLSDDRCTDVTLLDVRGISSVQDYVILASGTSDRQMRSAASGIKHLLPRLGSSVYRTSIDDQSTWIVVDCVDTVVHIFEPNTRSYYDLESMWGDAPKVEWLRPGQRPFTGAAEEQGGNAREGDTDEPAPAAPAESNEPDDESLDLDLTTVNAQDIIDSTRASIVRPRAANAAPKKTRKAAAPAARTKARAAAKPAPKKAAKKTVKKPAAKPAKKATSKPAAKKPTKKAAKKTTKKR